MNCQWCVEPILPEEIYQADQTLHHECRIRALIGSAAHQLHLCTCFGGTEHDPDNLTRRQSAMAAARVFYRLQHDRDKAHFN